MGTASRDPREPAARNPVGALLLAGLLIALALVALRPAAASANLPLSGDPGAAGDTGAQGSGVSQRSAVGQVLGLADGSTVQIQLDSAYSGSPTIGRLAAVLNSLPHGPEMSKLRIVLVDLNGLLQTCNGASSCYFPGQDKMVVPVDPDSIGMPMPFEMTVAHEYGHHIEANRNFEDWYATYYGGRNWATYERVCEGVKAGRMFPGSQGAHYWENPGEAFAQAYAFMLYPKTVPWWWNIAPPTEGSYAAIREDIADASGASSQRWARKLTPRASRASTTIQTPLDGEVAVRLKQPPGARFNLVLVSSDGAVLERGRHYRARSKRGRATALLSYDVCGTRSVRLEVRRRAGKGKFTAQIARP